MGWILNTFPSLYPFVQHCYNLWGNAVGLEHTFLFLLVQIITRLCPMRFELNLVNAEQGLQLFNQGLINVHDTWKFFSKSKLP